ncbi:MAG: hypothetical protein ACRDM7_12625, partial [Thermoleophilaceae bacterium]
LEALIAELPDGGALHDWRSAIGEAANAALRGELGEGTTTSIEEAVTAMEAALRRHRLRG